MNEDTMDKRREIAGKMINIRRNLENQKYGEFIIQTNKVQLYLILLIRLRSLDKSNVFGKHLEKLQFGQIITCFNICAKDLSEIKMVKSLKVYKGARNDLAHKMFTSEKLTIKECVMAINLGDELLKHLIVAIKLEFKNVAQEKL